MTIDPRPGLVGALALVSAVACVPDDPATLCGRDQGELIARARVDNYDTTTRIEVAFIEAEDGEGGLARRFCEDDTVTINGREATRIRRPSGNVVFTLSLTGPEETYRIALTNQGEPSELVATVPTQSLGLTGPPVESAWSRAEPLPITWTGALGEEAELTVIVQDALGGVTCLAPLYRAVVADTGAYELPAAALTVAPGVFAAKAECAAFVELLRVEEVPLETVTGAAFHADSRLLAATERRRDIVSIP